jgi:transketolase C-terminal domain/subunit
MRREFVSALVELAREDERIVLLTGDLGFAALEPFAEAFPDRFFNAGVAEQNMLGMATGLAEAGFTPYAYSIATFASMRGYEFIRNGAVLHNLPVRVVGIGEGVDYGHNGMTHYSLEDVGLMRMQPGLSIVVPVDAAHVGTALRAIQELDGPAEDLLDALDAAPLALSVEAHYVTGGIGSLLAEVIAEHGIPCRLIRAGVRGLPLGVSGEPEYMHEQLGISPRRLADQVLAGRALRSA